ncbi:MAG: SBBP repeat-containing protein, partial [Ignavibacteria bacterium]|nr:SBBP repeat-containing protein [Ignavibacteria bacterium]
ATFYGGNYSDYGYSITADTSGNIYVTGYTNSTNFPTENPGGGAYFQGSRAEEADAFVIKFNNSGIRIWATYYGGNGMDVGRSIESDISGNVFITGWSLSTNLPTYNPGGGVYFQGTYGGGINDAFILRFTNVGVRTWATYYGGNDIDYGLSAGTDISGNLYIAGETRSTNLPTQNPGGGAYFQGVIGGSFDAFILKFTNNGLMTWGSYYGGFFTESASSVTADISGNVFLTGQASANSLPVYNPGGGAYYQGTYGGGGDIIILKFTNSGVRQWATFYGGNNTDNVNSVSVDASGNVFIAGSTMSGTFPLYDAGGGAYYQGSHAGSYDVFILKFTNSGVRQWATYYGGDASDDSKAMSVAINGNIFISGSTSGGSFPLLDPGAGVYFQGTYGGGPADAFILKFTNNGVRQWATFYGGSGNDVGYGVCTDPAGNVFMTGQTTGGTFPLQNPGGGAYYQGTHGGEGSSDVFISKFGDALVSFTPIGNNIPESYHLHQNYPNPFNPLTRIGFDIPEEKYVRIIVYNSNGQLLSVLVDQVLKAGSYEFTFNGKNLSSGIYFYCLEAGDYKDIKKMILLK